MPRRHPQCLNRPRRGAVTMWLLLSAAVLLGVVALGTDGGRMMDERAAAQTAVDAAALAGAAKLYTNYWQYHGKDPGGQARAATLQSAAANRYDNDPTSNQVTVNIPPKSGAFAGKDGYVEVIARRHLDATFGRAVTKADLPVEARAVAQGLPMKLGIIALKPDGANTFQNKAVALTIVNAPLIVNSSDAKAYHQATFSAVLASRIDVTGGFSNTGGALMLAKVRTGVRPTPDPLALLPVPDPAALTVRATKPTKISGLVATLNPGVYRGGIHIEGTTILGLTLPAVVLMNPGLYYMEGGGFVVDGTSIVTGLGVTVYNSTSSTYASGPISVTSLGTVVLTAPLSGTYQGINFFQNRLLTQPVTFSGAATTITGVVYAPRAPVHVTGLLAVGLNLLGGAYVCDTMLVEGVGDVHLDLKLNPPRVPDVRLVE